MFIQKQCKDCSLVKDLSFFNKNPNGILKVEPRCKVCQSLYNKKYREQNKEKISLQRKGYYQNNKEVIKLKAKNYADTNTDNIRIQRKTYYQNNKPIIFEKARIYINKKRKTDPVFKLKESLRHRINMSLKSKKWKKNNTLKQYIGCSFEDLKFWFEFWFEEGMTWENHGRWHIDHIIPLSLAKNKQEMYKLCHYKNLQPLWALDNIRKGAK